MLVPSSYPKSVNSQVHIITPCNSCDICKPCLVAERILTSKVIGKTFYKGKNFQEEFLAIVKMINVKMNTWARQYISNLVVGYTKAIQKQKNER